MRGPAREELPALAAERYGGRPARAVAIVAGIVFVVFGLGKFVDHAEELRSFREYGLPWPELFVIAVGLVEVVGGALLVAGRWLRLAALALAGDMVGAIVVAGIGSGNVVPSLTLAPVLLVAMIYLIAVAPRQPLRRRR